MGVRKRPPYEGGTSHGDVTAFEEGVGDWPLPSRMSHPLSERLQSAWSLPYGDVLGYGDAVP